MAFEIPKLTREGSIHDLVVYSPDDASVAKSSMESRTGSRVLPRLQDDSQRTREPTTTLMRPCMTIPEDPKDTVASVLRARTWTGFRHIYGWLGVPIFFVFVLSAVWMMALAVVQLKPTYVANRLMDTAQFDFGEFWTLPKPDDRTAIVAIVALVLFAVGYVSLAVLMVFPDKLLSSATLATGRSSSRLRSVSAMIIQPQGAVFPASVCAQASAKPSPTRRTSTFVDVGRRIMYDTDNPMLALPKLVFQTVTLFTYLDEGFPATLIFSYSSLLLINWLLSGYRFTHTRPDPFLVISRFCYSFDLFFAVFAPMQVLVYSYTDFQFDREVFATRVAALNPSSFGRTARLYADPTEISLFRIAFQHLQLTTATSLLIKSVLNVLTIIKWRHVIIHLVQLSMIPREEIMNTRDDRPQPKHWQRRRRQAFALAFVTAGLATFVYSIVAVVTSTRVCETYTQCKVTSYQWNVGASHCSCIVFVDREPLVTTMAEWENPRDTTENLAALAYTGHLKIIQIINRQLPTLPEELRKCEHLEQLILIYAKIRTIPDWAKDFTKLEYLHIEGDLTTKQLTSMPRDLFINMDHLLFLHLGSHLRLPYLPELNSLVRLEYLVLAMLHKITEIPAIDKLVNLKKLSILDDIAVVRLPPVASLRNLNTFSLSYRNPVCCNGFLPGGCNLTAFSCLDRSFQGESRVQCSTDTYSSEDLATLTDTQGVVCPPNLPFDLKDVGPNYFIVDEQCGGVLYKQCAIDGMTGICFPTRMQPIMCTFDPEYVALRRLQIQLRVGETCDPSVEQWLGCSDTQ